MDNLGEPFFGYVEISTTTVGWRELFAIPFILDIGAGVWNVGTWSSPSNDDWTLVYMAEFAAGTFGLLAILASYALDNSLLMVNYAIFHAVLELGIIALITS